MMTKHDAWARPLVQAALNGDRIREAHASVPISLDDLVRDAVACVEAGARALHLHPRDATGKESLDGGVVNEVVRMVREACGVPVGVTTGAWIEPDLEKRLAKIRSWSEPDYTSVNISEDGSAQVMQELLERGIGIEAGVWTVDDAEALAASGFGNRVLRVLVEPGEMQVGTSVPDALALVEDIHRTLDRAGITAPRLQHADGAVTWAVLEHALRCGIDTRIGLEDTLYGPDGTRVSGNAELVRIACRLRKESAPRQD
jgi:uncharacterized protein (DUF849 family)